MNKLALIFLIPLLSLLGGCGNDNRTSQPYVMGHPNTKKAEVYSIKKEDPAIRIATIQAQTQKEVARINKERDLELLKIKEETKKEALSIEKEKNTNEHNLSVAIHQSESFFKTSTLFIFVISFLALLGLTLYIFKKRHADKMKIHEDELQKEMYIKEKELQVRMAEKILDTIATGKLSEDEEKHLLATLDKATPEITHKK